MRFIQKHVFVIIVFLSVFGCDGQRIDTQQGALLLEEDTLIPFYINMPKHVLSIDKSPVWMKPGQKIMLTGTVYKMDRKTPAPKVILYYYHTNAQGVYEVKQNEERNMPKNGIGQSHGYIRGWVKTNEDGKYSIFTNRPATYPSGVEPAHIHMTIKEEKMKDPYYIDDFVFDDDPLLTAQCRKKMKNRGGNGVIRFVKKDSLLIGERNIILGLNIPDYSIEMEKGLISGKRIGEDVLSFTPFHAYGPDKGTKACPICKYGWYHGVLYFVGNRPITPDVERWLKFLDTESEKRKTYLKVYFIYGCEANYKKESREKELETLGRKLNLTHVALTFLPSFTDEPSEVYLNRINPDIENTFVIYKRSIIVGKFLNLKPNEQNFIKLNQVLDNTINEFFNLPRIKTEK